TSQPSPGCPLQLAKPLLQLAMPQLPALHAGVPLATEHALPQPPQLVTLVCVFVSQPSGLMPLRSANPGLQLVTVQVDPTHVGVPFGAVHTFPQLPQFEAFVDVFTSQPSATRPSQLANGALHDAMAHDPAVHAAVPFATEQAVPHAPQFATLVCVLVSQPS